MQTLYKIAAMKGEEKMPQNTKEELLSMFGSGKVGEVSRIHSFARIPEMKIETLSKTALEEKWGSGNFVLRKYLAVHVPLSIEQEKYCWNGESIFVSAGSLKDRFGIPIYLEFSRNLAGREPFYLKWVGTQPRIPVFPEAPAFSTWPEINMASEIVISTEHILGENAGRIPFLQNTPPVAQMCAVTGAISWSLYRKLYIRQMYFGVESFFVPLYLQSREDITGAPDLVAPVQVQNGRLIVRTVLLPFMTYQNARVVVERHDELPPWLISAWQQHSHQVTEEELMTTEELCEDEE